MRMKKTKSKPKKKTARASPRKKTVKGAKAIKKPAKASPKKKTPARKGTKEKEASIKESLAILHSGMGRSLRRIEELMTRVQHEEHHPKIIKAIKRFEQKQKKNLDSIAKKA